MRCSGRGDLLPDGPGGQVEPGHEHHGLEPGQRVAGRVGVDGRDRAVVAGVHGLEHVEGLGPADLADDDAVGPHAQRVADEVADADLASTFDVGRPALEADHVALAELELDRVLDGDDALGVGHERRQHVEQRRLAGAGPAGHEDVQPAADAGRDQLGDRRRERPEPDQVVDLQRVAGELADGEHRAVDGQRRDHRVDAGAVGQAGVDHRRRLVDAPADLGDDALDDPPEVVGGEEAGVGRLDHAVALDVDGSVALTMTSEIVGSSRKRSIGPSPTTSSMISSTSRCRSSADSGAEVDAIRSLISWAT